MDWTIQQVAKMAGTTSRTLRHYDEIGLLAPSSTGGNGYRRYDETALVRLQRILLLRQLGLALPDIAAILDRVTSETDALRAHLAWLRQERDRVERQIASVQTTIDAREGGERLMAQDMFDGFDHTRYKDEVERRWGADAYARSDAWWRGQDPQQRAAFQEEVTRLSADWAAAAERGIDPAGDEAQALAQRHVAWVSSVPGVPDDTAGYVRGLGAMYVADPRFSAHYGGQRGAEFVRDALDAYADARL